MPDASPLQEHFGELVPWAFGSIGTLLVAFFALWNRSQSIESRAAKRALEGEIRLVLESIKGLRDLHEQQEKRFDEREKTIRHELGASIGVAIARADRQDERLAAAIEGMNACQKAHLTTGVRHEHITEIKEGIKEIFGRLGTIEKSMAAFHAKHGGEQE